MGKIKDYFEHRKLHKSLEIIVMNRYRELLDSEIEKNKLEEDILRQNKIINNSFSENEIKEYVNMLKNISEFTQEVKTNPDLKDTFYARIQERNYKENLDGDKE